MSKLSYEKFITLLEKKSYTPTLIYYNTPTKENEKSSKHHSKSSSKSIENNQAYVVFFEVKLPKTQKSVLIHISSKYKMTLPESTPIKKIKLLKTNKKSSLTENSLFYLIQARGPLIEADLSAISSDGLCYSKLSGENECYFFDIGSAPTTIEKKPWKKEKDKLKKLEKDVKKTAKSLDITLKTHKKIVFEEEKNDEENSSEISDDKGVELVFSDEHQPETKEDEKSIDFSEDSFSGISSDSFSIDEEELAKLPLRTNAIFPEELDVNMGIIYVTTDVGYFYKNISEYEKEALEVYEQLDDNEIDSRISRINEIKKKINTLNTFLDKKVKKIENEEKALKYQLLRLSNILSDADTLKTKIENNPKKDDINTSEVDKVYNQTRKTVHDLNIELIRKKEDIEEIITDFEESVHDLLSI
jgi:hypothetical protein